MNAATKNTTALNMSFNTVFNTDINLVEPEDRHQDSLEYFHDKIIADLTADNFYSFTYPTDNYHSLDGEDIINVTFDNDDIKAMHYKLMTTKNDFEVVSLRREIRTLAIKALADEFAEIEAKAA